MPNGQVIQHPMWPPGVGPNRPVHPGPAPIHPPWGGPHPDWCDCGCDPCTCGGGMPNWSQDAIRCWNEMQQFRQMVQEIVQGELARGGTAIVGVTDGSDAKPGEVGEFITAKSAVPYAAHPANTNTNISPIVIPPGDWDIWVKMDFTTQIGAVTIILSPKPDGISNALSAASGFLSPTGSWAEGYSVLEATARGSFKVPTLLPFAVNVNQQTTVGLPGGTGTFTVEARRRR